MNGDVYARHGRELMGFKSPVSVFMLSYYLTKLLAEGKGVTVRWGLKEAREQVSEDSETVS